MITLLLLAVLLGGSIWTMQHTYARDLDQYGESVEANYEEVRAAEQLWQFMSGGMNMEKRPGAMAVLGRGLEGEMTRTLSYSGWNEVEVGPLRIVSPLLRIFAAPDFIYIINIIGSLLALLFVYDAVCGEKEQGTLRLKMTYPVPRDYILLAKWAGGLISLGLPLMLVSVGLTIFLMFIPGFEFTLDIALRFALIFIISLVYLSVFFTLGLLVSSLTRDATTSLMVCLFLWIILVLTLPNLMPMIARTIKPIPSEGKIAIEKRHKAREVEEWASKTIRVDMHDEDEYHETVARLVAQALEGLNQFRRNRVQEQMTLAMNLSRISPSSCFQFAAADLAQTGIGTYARFQRYVVWYRQLFNQAKDQIAHEARDRANGWWGHAELLPADLNLIPSFKPLSIPFTDSLNAVLFDILTLITYNIVLFLAAYAAFIRYDVR
jgi:ABC-type transport system involved in multi-copper enzyme maturation permease subunit